MKYGFIEKHRGHHAVHRLCHILAVSRSGFYAWLQGKLSHRQGAHKVLDEQINQVFAEHRGRYGSPRMTRQLQSAGVQCSESQVARRMNALGLKAVGKKKFRTTTDSKHTRPIYDNVLNRDFTTTAVNQKWVCDITYCATQQGWLYLATVLDLHSRAIVGWSMATHMKDTLVCDALMMALFRNRFPTKVIVHSDRGSQYASQAYRQLINQHNLIGSMSRKANCWDNSVAESFFHTLKNELIHQCQFQNQQQAKQEVFDYIETYYNRKRIHSAIDYRVPAAVQWAA